MSSSNRYKPAEKTQWLIRLVGRTRDSNHQGFVKPSPPAIHCAVVKQHHEVFDQEAPAGLPQRCLKFVLKVGQHVWVSSQCSTVFRIKPFSGRFIIIGVHTSSSLSFIVIVLIFCFIFSSPGTQRASKVSLSKVWWRASMWGVTFTADLFPFFILNLI